MSEGRIATQLHKLTISQGTIWYRYNCKVEVLFPNSNKTRDLTYVNSEGPR